MLKLEKICKYYNPGTVNEMCLFEDYDLTVEKGEFVSIVGSNGSGKTSMLNIICGSIPLDSGKLYIDDREITKMPEHKRAAVIGRVYQNPALGTCPDMTILENMSMADTKGKPFNLRRGTDKERIGYYQELLAGLGLGLENKLSDLGRRHFSLAERTQLLLNARNHLFNALSRNRALSQSKPHRGADFVAVILATISCSLDDYRHIELSPLKRRKPLAAHGTNAAAANRKAVVARARINNG